jgi:hypothetical protein
MVHPKLSPRKGGELLTELLTNGSQEGITRPHLTDLAKPERPDLAHQAPLGTTCRHRRAAT